MGCCKRRHKKKQFGGIIVHMPGQGIHSVVHILCGKGELTSQHFFTSGLQLSVH